MVIKNEKGITLIALVITIIVMLILAGVSLSMTIGENGIVTKARTASAAYDIARAKEEVELLAATYATDYLSNDTDKNSMGAYIMSRFAAGNVGEDYILNVDGENLVLKRKDGTQIAKGIIDSNGSIKWNDSSSKTTLGQVYNDGMIGKEITYTSDNNYSDWIIFGPELDENGNRTGNVLATSKNPISNKFVLNADIEAAAHFTLKEGETGFNATDENGNFLSLNKVCLPYSGTMQGKAIKARSITLEDINYVVGYTKPDTVYTFGTEYSYADKKVPFYYISMLGANRTDDIALYHVKPGEILNGTTIPDKQIQATYFYQKTEETLTKANNMKYVIGESENYMYMVSSLSVSGDGYKTISITNFWAAAVHDGEVSGYFARLCYTSSTPGNSYDNMDNKDKMNTAIRPVVVLPGDLEVEETSDGGYDIKQ